MSKYLKILSLTKTLKQKNRAPHQNEVGNPIC